MSETVVSAPGAATTVTTEGAPAAAAATTVTAPTTSVDWTSSLPEEHRGYVSNKGFKDPASVVNAYVNMEKLMGVPQDRLLKLPEKFEGPEMDAIFNRLGRPEKPEDYKLPAPGEGQDKSFHEWAQKNFHELGLTRAQAEKLHGKFGEFAKEQTTNIEKAYAQKVESETTDMKKEWGSAYDQNIKIAKQAAISLGLDDAKIDALEQALGFKGTMQHLHMLGTKVGEGDFVSGNSNGSNNFSLTPREAQDKISALGYDKDFTSRLMKGDAATKTEWQRLHEQAYPS